MIAKTLILYFMSCVFVYICYDVLRKTSLKEKIEIGKKGLSISLLLVVGAVVCAVLSFVGNLN
jgi:amino acid transporter